MAVTSPNQPRPEALKPAEQPGRGLGAAVERPILPEQRESRPGGGFEAPAATAETPLADQAPATAGAADVGAPLTATEQQIERIMEEGLAEFYVAMPPDKQFAFRKAGEETARQINRLLHETKVQVKKIISLLKDWLKLIPGINRFFLEQEIKIKADELLKLRRPNP